MRSLIPISLVAISIGLFYLYISPNYETVQNLKTEQGQYQDALDKAKELENKRDELITKYNNFSEDDIARLNRILPNKVNTVKLITDLDTVAGRYGISIRSVTVAQAVIDNAQAITSGDASEKPFNTTTISFRFTATYSNLVLFLKDLEKSLQMVDVESVRFDVPGEDTNSGIYQYEVSINTYWLK